MFVWRGQRGREKGNGRGIGRGGVREYGESPGGGGGRSSGRAGGRGGRRGGRTLDLGRVGTGRHQLEVNLGFTELQALEIKTPDEITLHLTTSRCFPATEYLLKRQSVMKDHWIILILNILTKACYCDCSENLLKLLNLLPGSSFLNSHLRPYLNKLPGSGLSPADLSVFLRNVVKIMNELLRRFPSCYADLPVSDLYCATRMLSDTGELADGALVAEVDEIMKLRIEKAEELKRKEEEERQKRRKPRRDGGNDDADPPEDFRMLPVVPTQKEITSGERPFLRRNKIDGSYHDAEHYLDVQFRLLREDFVRPLREGIAQLLERIGSCNIGAHQDIRLYNNVRLLYPVCTSNGLRHRIKFDNSKLRHVRWENSKRLIFGSLMCLSKDNFDSCVFATVANRELWNIRQGIVDIQFIRLYYHAELEDGDVYQMVESTAFFEAYRHVLDGLKEITPADLPFQNYIVNCQKEVEPPAYLNDRFQGPLTFDLTPIMRERSSRQSLRSRLSDLNMRVRSRQATNVPVLNLASWPSAEDLGLDDSQFKALQMALTKEFTVIQGPPGTGKTYIGLKIANVLLHNKGKWDTERVRLYGTRHRPILVVCYTNHALDQFLEGIHQFHPDGIVRVGGRSQSETMQACSLSQLKHEMHKEKSVPFYIRRAFYEAHVLMDRAVKRLETATQGLQECLENVLHEDELRYRAMSMTEAHYESLRQPFVETAGHKLSAMLQWLQLSVNSAIQASQGEGPEMLTEAEVEEAEPLEAENEDNDDNPHVLYEANVMQDQRTLDDDDIRVFSSKSVGKSMEQLKVVNPFVFIGEGDDEWQIQRAHRLKRKLKRIVNEELSKKDFMSDEEAKMVTNVWNLKLSDRWSLYRRWAMDVRKRYRFTISYLHYEFEWGVQRLKEAKTMQDLDILERADVIGMTTTGAAKYRKLLQSLKPRITIVEEAAEVLESHIVTSLTPGCQHVILIGDHQQLRPNPTVYELAVHYKLDVSLFERMVKNGMPFTRLRLQHRMRPEISKMLEHIYDNPKLENHESVMKFGNIKGVACNAFFVDHEESEDFTVEGMSRSNKHEAKFMAALCRYFILQGYEREQITILTAYVGQLTQLKKELVPKDFFSGVRVCAVDNFQGEENDIILLSLVRSNEEGKIGFLQIENRVCVALSRAKKGFFCIGNISLLETKSTLWREIIKDMRERGNVAKAMMLMCQNHPKNVIHASCAEDFKKAPNGGCTIPCATRLECGHVCDMMCHPVDPEHLDYECQRPCVKTWPCGHENATKCYVDPLRTPCKVPCAVTLNCEHPCAGDCSRCFRGRVHVPCKAKCDRPLFCKHKCGKKCGDPCDLCIEKCTWECLHHKCTKLCGELCDRPRCNEPCTKLLPCQHPCIGLCGEICPKKCRECHKDEVKEIYFGTEDDPDARFVELADCGHVFEVQMMDQWMDQAETTPDEKPIDVQLKLCPKCRVPIRTSLRYGNIIKKILADFERINQKIELDKGSGERDLEVARLKLRAQEINQFPKYMLNRKNLTDDQINVIDNQISFLSFLQTLKVNIGHFEELPQETKNDLESKVEQLQKRVMEFRVRFSDQEREELTQEMYRTQLLIDFRMLKMQLDIQDIQLGVTDTAEVFFVKEELDSGKVIDRKHQEQYRAHIERIRREQRLPELNKLTVKRDENDLIAKSMGFTQGH
ncbi:NFX1-type zinc finger-containing protein 1-like [Montipora foliosa]|uniref:NFX1-type zinc finger-containing protein 1-like n=1 Tax=Montipora foliosa TaxID=591990 RepID=UPI0035F1442A